MAKVQARLDELLANNAEFAKTWKNPADMPEMRAQAKASEAGVVVLTCLDPRCVPEQYFHEHPPNNLRLAVLRNAGGRATPDIIKSILALRTLVDVRGVFVVHHTDCGMSNITDDEILADIKRNTPDAVDEEVAKAPFGSFDGGKDGGFEDAIREDVEFLRGQKTLEGVVVRGLGFWLGDGGVRVVV